VTDFKQLPPDQQAVISLLVRQGRSYAQVAALLAIEESAVRSRAHQALAGLADGPPPADVGDDDVALISDYVLGQLDESERIAALALLMDSASASAWGRGLASQLEPLATVALPQVPSDGEPAAKPRRRAPRPAPAAADADAPAPRPRPRRPRPAPADAEPVEAEPVAAEEAEERPATRPARRRPERPARPLLDRGRGVLLAAGLILVVAIVVFIVGSGGSSNPSSGPIPASAATATSTTGGTGTGTSAASDGVLAEVPMKATTKGSSAKGEAAVVQNGSTKDIAFEASGLAAPGSSHYVLWLYESATQYKVLGEIPSVKKGVAGPVAIALPSDASSYRGVLLTLESSDAPTAPTTPVLLGSSSSGL
jgi:hypothetical protein